MNSVLNCNEKLKTGLDTNFVKSIFEGILWFGGVGDVELSEENIRKIRGFIRALQNAETFGEAIDVIRHYFKKEPIKGMGLTTLSIWATIVRPEWFFPTLGKGGARKSLPLSQPGTTVLGLTTKDVDAIKNNVESYKEFLKVLREASSEASVNDLAEVSFYLSRYNAKNSPTAGPTAKGNRDKSRSGAGLDLREFLLSRGYEFPRHIVAQFYVALKTKGFVILAGLTGSGKTKLALEFARLVCGDDDCYVFVPVRPDWSDSKAMVGYFNPLDGRYYRTPLLDLVLEARKEYLERRGEARPYFVILDEMNLARVEYYFADFLSVLESGRDEGGFTRESIKLHNVDGFDGVPREVRLPPNLYVVGTVNIDETTYMFSPKVLDRAFTIELRDVNLKDYGKIRSFEASNAGGEDSVAVLRNAVLEDLCREGKFAAFDKNEVQEALKDLERTGYLSVLAELNEVLEPYDLHFGYRVVDEIALFFKNARESQSKGIIEFRNDDEVFDLALMMKVLPKFHGSLDRLERPLLLVLALAKDGRLSEDVTELSTEDLFRRVIGGDAVRGSEAVVKVLKGGTNAYKFKHTARKVLRMLRQLYELNFASFS